MKVAPSILAADFANLAADVARVAPVADLLHVDCMDGHYVPNLTIGPPVVKSLRKHTDLFLDCHLMVDNPGVLLAAFADAGADGCTIHSAVIGTQGALISQTCAHPKCDGLTFCGSGPQLLLRDAGAGRSDAAKDRANPDQIKWNLIGTSAVPASADTLISAVDPVARQLQVLDVAKGATRSRLQLPGGVASTGGIAALASDRAELLWIAGTTYAVGTTGAALLWTAPTSAPPTVTQVTGTASSTPDLQASSVAVAGAGGITLLDPGTGKTARSFPVAAPRSGSLVYPLGTGFVVAGAATTVYR